jgi:hyperpolarization activated cyclic nucleotide-gated potassium channel 2
MKRRLITQDYLKKWFAIDLLSSMPYTWILAWSEGIGLREIEADDNLAGAISNTPQLLRLLKIAKLLKMLKLLRVVKIKRILMKFEEYIVTDSMDLMVTFMNITVKIIVIAHYMGCFFFYFGMDAYRETSSGWIIVKEIIDEDFYTQYITSLYWAFTTMSAVGYGDIVPITRMERAYAMAAMIMACGIFAYTVNSIGNIVSRYN